MHTEMRENKEKERFQRIDIDWSRSEGRSEKRELNAACLRWGEQIAAQAKFMNIQPELFTGDLKPTANLPCIRAFAAHPLAPFGIIVLTAAHGAQQ